MSNQLERLVRHWCIGLSGCSHSAKPVSDQSYLLLSYFLLICGNYAGTCIPLMHITLAFPNSQNHLLRLPSQEGLSGNPSLATPFFVHFNGFCANRLWYTKQKAQETQELLNRSSQMACSVLKYPEGCGKN